MAQKNNNEVTNFMYYICNNWSLEESWDLFGYDLGLHVWQKWFDRRNDIHGDFLWYSELDNECKNKIIARANELYAK